MGNNKKSFWLPDFYTRTFPERKKGIRLTFYLAPSGMPDFWGIFWGLKSTAAVAIRASCKPGIGKLGAHFSASNAERPIAKCAVFNQEEYLCGEKRQ